MAMNKEANEPDKGNRHTSPGSKENLKQNELKEAHTNIHHNKMSKFKREKDNLKSN